MFFTQLKHTKNKMKTKTFLVSFFAIATIVFLATAISAADPLTDNLVVKVNDEVADANDLSVVAGESITVTAVFNSLVDASDVIVKAEIEGNKVDVSEQTSSFDVESGFRYTKKLTVQIPYELKDEVSDDANLVVTIKKGSEYKTNAEFTLRVQRPSYNAEVLSIVSANTVEAGEDFPVDVVLKNMGYNDLDDLYVTAKLSALNGVERTVYFGDLVALEDDDDDDDTSTISGRINLKMPFDAESGIYVLEILVSNDDVTVSQKKQIVVENDFPNSVMKAGNDLLIVNPTDKLKVYRVVFPESETFVTVSPGSTKAVEVALSSEDVVVNVLTMSGELVDSFKFDAVQDDSVANPVVVLTVILAIIFLVLLIVLIVLIGKKPEKAEEFGESYY